MKFDRDKFWDSYRDQFGHVTQSQVDAIEFLLSQFEQDAAWKNVHEVSYALATIKHETANTFEPIHELGGKSYFNKYDIAHAPKKARELGNVHPGDGYLFRGRGYVQLTGRANYAKYGIADNPDSALDPSTAFRILSEGMHKGSYTGKRLSDYIKATDADYYDARRIINGTDKASTIAGYAEKFEDILTTSTAESAEQEASAPLVAEPGHVGTSTNIPTAGTDTPSPPEPPSIAPADTTTVTAPVEPVPVTPARPTLQATAVAFFTMIYGYYKLAKEDFGDTVDKVTNSLDLHTIVNLAIGAGLVILGIWWHNRSRQRAAELTQSLIQAASDQQANTVALVPRHHWWSRFV